MLALLVRLRSVCCLLLCVCVCAVRACLVYFYPILLINSRDYRIEFCGCEVVTAYNFANMCEKAVLHYPMASPNAKTYGHKLKFIGDIRYDAAETINL